MGRAILQQRPFHRGERWFLMQARSCILCVLAFFLPGLVLVAQSVIPIEQTREAKGLLYTGTQLVSGTVVDMRQGPIQSECGYLAGQRHGECRTYHPNEKLARVEHYQRGRLHGMAEERHPNGELRVRYEYVMGVLSNGNYLHYDDSGAIILDQEVEGGTVVRELVRVGGEVHGPYVERHVQGPLKMTGQYERGKRTGIFRTYDANGTLVKETAYENGARNGASVAFNDQGRQSSMEYYAADTLVRRQLSEYHSNGTLLRRVEQDNRRNKHGLTEEFWSDGTLKRRSYFEGGREVEVMVENNDDPERSVAKIFDPTRHVLLTPDPSAARKDAVVIVCEATPKDPRDKGDVALRDAVVGRLRQGRLSTFQGVMSMEADYLLILRDIDLQISFDDGKNTFSGSGKIIQSTTTITTPPGYVATVFIPITLKHLWTGEERREMVAIKFLPRDQQQQAFDAVFTKDAVWTELDAVLRKLFP